MQVEARGTGRAAGRSRAEEEQLDFALSDEQERLRDSARELLARECPSDRVRKIMASASGHDPDLQRTFAEAGWLGILVPEAHGGAGLALLDAARTAPSHRNEIP